MLDDDKIQGENKAGGRNRNGMGSGGVGRVANVNFGCSRPFLQVIFE